MPSESLQTLFAALELRAQGKLSEAIAVLARGIEISSSADLEALPLLTQDIAILSEMAGHTDLGIEYLKKALAVVPGNLNLLYTLARLLIATDRIAEARPVVDEFRLACKYSTSDLRSGWADLLEPLENMLGPPKTDAN